MMNLKQAKEILEVINPNDSYTAGPYFDTFYLNSTNKEGKPYCTFRFRKYNNNLIIVCENNFNDIIFIIGKKRVIKNIMNKYNFEIFNSSICQFYKYSYLNYCNHVKDTDIVTFTYFKDFFIDKRFIDFLENELKDLNDSEKLFLELED